ncbi:polycystic kidney disease protein 1-like 3 isoform X2 [Homarus americanus]|uniref:polycystic kidney disease protein 1-like 3 isoform X2 n=1 Tax=Homarus americanus TaxID=6706 RepID=UPI001C477EF7|nr:polycystic kidney disease protein 1-like 3 isoform X2 [Homarus americanus]
MGACIARCWPLIADPRYQPVRSRYLIHDETVQTQPSRLSSISTSSDESLCMSEVLLPGGDPEDDPQLQQASEEDVTLLSFTPPAVTLSSGWTHSPSLHSPTNPPLRTGLTPSPPLQTVSTPSPPLLTGSSSSPPLLTWSTPSPPLLTGSSPSPPLLTGSSPSPPLLTGSSPSPLLLTGSSPSPPLLTGSSPSPPLLTGSRSSTPLPADSELSTPLTVSPPHSPLLVGLPPRQAQYYNLTPQAEDEVELTPHLEQQDISDPPPTTTSRVTPVGGGEQRWWGLHGAAAGSLPSLTEPESPPTTSLDLEWEPEAGLARASRESLREEERSQTAESNSWVPRSSCSTPNSLEWDFRASTLSLRGGMEDETWQHTDLETEQLLQEIEQLAARALADTGHGLQPPPR